MLNRSQRNEGVQTVAMILFKDMKLILERPENMNRLEYKITQRFQKKLLKKAIHRAPNKNIHIPNRLLWIRN